MNGIGPITEKRLVEAYHLGGTVPASHFCYGADKKKGKNKMPTLLSLNLVSWADPGKFTTVNLTHKGRQFVSEILPSTFPKS